MEQKLADFHWSVENYCMLPIEPGEIIASDFFYVEDSRAVKFCFVVLKLEPPYDGGTPIANIFLARCDEDGPRKVNLGYKIILNPESNESVRSASKSKKYMRDFFKSENLNLYLNNNDDEMKIYKSDLKDEMTLKSRCIILSYQDDKTANSKLWDTSDLKCLSDDLKKLFCNHQLFWDEVIGPEENNFKIHKAILEARCPLLLKMNQGDEELESTLLHDEDSLKMLLNYVYSGEFEQDKFNPELFELTNDSTLVHLYRHFPSQIHMQTSLKTNKIHFNWTIKNFLVSQPGKEFSRVLADGDDYTKFILSFNRYKRSSREKLKFTMRTLIRNAKAIVNCTLRFSTSNAKYIPDFQKRHVFVDEKPWEVLLDTQLQTIRRNMNNHSADNSVNFEIDLEVFKAEPEHSVKAASYWNDSCKNEIKYLCRLGHDMKKLYENPKYSDIIIKIGDKAINAHKAILSARSEKFNEILQQRNAQKKLNSELKNWDEKVVSSMICYIYSAQVELDGDLASKLYDVSEKLGIPELRKKCLKFLKATKDIHAA